MYSSDIVLEDKGLKKLECKETKTCAQGESAQF